MKKLSKSYLYLTITFILLITGTVWANSKNPMDLLTSQIDVIEKKLNDTVEDHHKPTLYAIKIAAVRAKSKFEDTEEFGPYHSETRNALQRYIAIADSPSFFKAIETPTTSDTINTFLQQAGEIKRILGLDSPLGNYTYSTFSQIKNLLESLDDHPVSDNLDILTKEILIKMARLLSTSRGEDTLPMFEKGRDMVFEIRELYQIFDDNEDLLRSNSAFHIALEIRGLNESYYYQAIRSINSE